MDLIEKKRVALQTLADCGSVVVALSGGVDSSVLLALALESLGPERVLAATGDSPSLAAGELESARRTALRLGAKHEILPTSELDRSGYRANRGDRCFHCRLELFETLTGLARARGLARVVYGAIADDLTDHRPGMRAAEGLEIGAPLLEAGLDKADVRALAVAAGLEVADKPAGACLASRLPVGTEVTPERLARVERAEAALAELGLGRLRVRHHGDLARVELEPDAVSRALDPDLRARMTRAVRDAGYRFVTLDLEGYRPGGGPARTAGSETPDDAQRTGPTRDTGQ